MQGRGAMALAHDAPPLGHVGLGATALVRADSRRAGRTGGRHWGRSACTRRPLGHVCLGAAAWSGSTTVGFGRRGGDLEAVALAFGAPPGPHWARGGRAGRSRPSSRSEDRGEGRPGRLDHRRAWGAGGEALGVRRLPPPPLATSGSGWGRGAAPALVAPGERGRRPWGRGARAV